MNQTTLKSPPEASGKLGWGLRFAYGCGDTACNLVFGMMSTILTLFYTDYAGVPAATVGLVMLLSRVFDGVSDMIMGVVVEHTHSKWGKSRPWLLWMSVPFAISAVLLFTVPHTTAFLQFLYIFVTYNFCTTVCYTAINLPYGSLSAMMTRNSDERAYLSIVRMGLSPFGRILAVTVSLPLIQFFGNDQAAWIKTMSIWGVLAVILLVINFAFCKETVQIEAVQNQAKIPLGRSLKALATNRYFWAILILWAMQNSIFTFTGTILPYYCRYIFDNDTWLYSTLYLVETLVLVAGTFCSPMLLKWFGKRNMSLAGAILAFVGQLVFFLNPYSVQWLFFSCIVRAIGLAPFNSVVFGMLGDAVEYGQWKTHVRQESMVFAGGSVGAKVGAGLTSFAITSLLGLAGFISSTTGGTAQPDSALNMIVNVYKIGPLVIWAVIIIVLALYQLDKKYDQIMQDLAEREARGEV